MRLLALKSVLVATDLRESSWPALRTGSQLATLAEARLHLLHVTEDDDAIDRSMVLESFRRAVPDAPEPDTVSVVPGVAADVIVEHAALEDVDTIVMGRHRRTGRTGEMGGTASRVVRTARVPCLVASTRLRLPLQRVVVPIDLSTAAGGALSVALTWTSALRARDRDVQLVALHVAAVGAPATLGDELHAEVERARKWAQVAPGVSIVEQIVPGMEPVEGILKSVTSEHADLLVMGTRGAALATSELGSVSAAVARDTPSPLLLVPPEILEENRLD